MTEEGMLLGVGDWTTAEAPDGSPRRPTIWTSPDGLAWQRQQDSPAFVSNRAFWEEQVRALVQVASGFVAVGTESQQDASLADAAAWFSPDGVTWARAPVDDGIGRTMDDVVATPGGLVALGESRYSFHAGFGGGTAIWTSPDGRVWTRLADAVGPPPGTRLREVTRRPGGFLAAAAFEEPAGYPDTPGPPLTSGIWTSSDAIHWAPIPGTPLGLNDLIATDSGYVAIGSGVADASAGTMAWRSSDGQTWTGAVLPSPSDLTVGATLLFERVATSPVGLLAFGMRDDDSTEVGWSSPDGVDWTLVDLRPELDGAVVDNLFPIGDSLLVSAHFDQDGSWVPVAWLLRA
ncbi:MAG TPA: hypothetical protein VF494_03945 [Candidatus Limnocylindrales bacterium]